MIPRLTLRADPAAVPVVTADVEAAAFVADAAPLVTVCVGDVCTLVLDVDTADALADALIGALVDVADRPAGTPGG